MSFEKLSRFTNKWVNELKINKVSNHNKLYVSLYPEGVDLNFSARLNSLDNRINNLNLEELFFLIFDIKENKSFRSPGGLNIGYGQVEVFWPHLFPMEGIYKKFRTQMLVAANNPLRQELLLSSCKLWEDNLKKRLSK